ncbi:uncharacterized protein LOC142329238 [Lycorma delicatula]|uniref:uncharacterized protein LOC142329238 n=1 Tax=Lycorma delicatula TaxID=130591 RepID=UPI003F519B14
MNVKLKSLSNMWLTFFIFLITTSNKDNCYGEELSFFNRTFLNENIFTTLKNSGIINSDFNFLNSKANYKTEDQINVNGTYLNTTELISKQGFGAEVHEVTTEDGYILKLTRIITEKGSLHTPVLFQHGILSASEQFLLRGRGQDLAFILAENGYDVWLGDQRGNVYSRAHVKYHPNEAKFWDFSFHESGIYDLPAFINKIQDRTKASQIIYIGHSLGTTVFLVMASQRPEYAKKIKLSVLLAPACFITPPFQSSILNWIYEHISSVVNYYVSRNQYVILPQRNKLQRIVQNICSNKNTIHLCLLLGDDLFGENRDNLDKKMIPFYFRAMLSGTSVKTGVHLSQLIKTEKFQLYDYGSLKNQKIYGSYTPPSYKIDQIQTPVALLYGNNDAIVKKKTELISKQGFGAEVHEVTTEDGYILKLTRIITEKGSLHTPVLFQHGILSTSEYFLLRGRGQDLAFILAENGYDVWLGDQRGNVYSRAHVKYHPNETKFWDFSFHESGIYDLPAFINKIQDRTKASQIIYIGHSMGTTVFLVMASQRPEYAKKIKLAVLLAPVCFITPPIRSSIFNWIYEHISFLVNFYVLRNQYIIFPQRNKLQRIVQNICSNKNTIDLCLLIGDDLFGENRDNLDKKMIPFYFRAMLSGTSVKTGVHLSQLIKTEKFQLYDYGSLKNQKIYGSYTPPTYKIEQIQTPVALLYGNNDAIVKKKEVIKLEKTLPNLVMSYEVTDPKFNHVDFISGNNAVELVYDKILQLLKSYNHCAMFTSILHMNIKLKSLSKMWLSFFNYNILIFLITIGNKDNCYGEELSFYNRTFLNENIFTTLKNSGKINSDFNFLNSKANYKTEDQINVIGTYLNTTELIIQQGFGAEVHEVTTEDGYILKLTRIITQNVSLHTPVIIQHGLFAASDQFLLRGRSQDLAFILAENGYDVWLGDQRGNVYSRAHVKYHPTEKKFWDFSFHESAIYDLSAFINKIQDRTKTSQIIYIGYSLGNTVFLVMASQRPEYAKKIKLAVLLAPVCFITPPIRSSLINLAYENAKFLVNFYILRNQYVIFPQRDKLRRILQNICSNKNFIDLCLLIGDDLFGENRDNLDKKMISLYFGSALSGASLKTAVHVFQLIKTEKFQQYDYGSLKNLKIYGSYTPPSYKIEQIQTPIALLYGKNDALVKKKDVIKLENSLPNLVMSYEVPDPKFNHGDFIFGNNAVELVYDKILQLIKSYN